MPTQASDYDLVSNIKTMAENINENLDFRSLRQSTVWALPFSFTSQTKSPWLIGPETTPPPQRGSWWHKPWADLELHRTRAPDVGVHLGAGLRSD